LGVIVPYGDLQTRKASKNHLAVTLLVFGFSFLHLFAVIKKSIRNYPLRVHFQGATTFWHPRPNWAIESQHSGFGAGVSVTRYRLRSDGGAAQIRLFAFVYMFPRASRLSHFVLCLHGWRNLF
jgi:hypothetical protein